MDGVRQAFQPKRRPAAMLASAKEQKNADDY